MRNIWILQIINSLSYELMKNTENSNNLEKETRVPTQIDTLKLCIC